MQPCGRGCPANPDVIPHQQLVQPAATTLHWGWQGSIFWELPAENVDRGPQQAVAAVGSGRRGALAVLRRSLVPHLVIAPIPIRGEMRLGFEYCMKCALKSQHCAALAIRPVLHSQYLPPGGARLQASMSEMRSVCFADRPAMFIASTERFRIKYVNVLTAAAGVTGLWTVKAAGSPADAHDAFLLISTAKATRVLATHDALDELSGR